MVEFIHRWSFSEEYMQNEEMSKGVQVLCKGAAIANGPQNLSDNRREVMTKESR